MQNNNFYPELTRRISIKIPIITLSLFLGLFCFVKISQAATYYVDATGGNNTNSGTSEATAWKTISKVNSRAFSPGDFILFKKGEMWREQLNYSSSGTSGHPITFSAYGNGANPIISGFTNVSSWTNLGNNIWESTAPVSTLPTVNMVTVNGVNTVMGRYPNTEYLTFESHSGTTSITDNELSGSPSWTGAELVIRTKQWVLDRTSITAQSGGTLTYSPAPTYEPTNGFGYFIQNDSRTLDSVNEWYYNPSTKKIRIYSSGSPTNVQVSNLDILVLVHGAYATFDGLTFQGANRYAFYNSWGGMSNLNIQNCSILFSGIDAIKLANVANFKIENSTISNSNNNGVRLDDGSVPNATIRNNVIQNTGILPGMGQSGNASYTGISCPNSGLLAEFNKIINTGYIGIDFAGNSILVKNNFIDTFCTVKQDGGGIYTWNGGSSPSVNTNRKIIGNVVINGIGAVAGTNDPYYIPAEGIYLDDNTANVEVANNSVANVANQGIFLHDAHEINVHDNTVYNNLRQLGFQQDGSYHIQNNIINNNIFVSKLESQLALYYANYGLYTIGSLGSADNNYYARPIDDNYTFYLNQPSGVSYNYNLAQWQSYSGFDIHSLKSPIEIPSYTLNSLIGNNKFINGTFNSNVNGTYCWSPANNCVEAWDNTGQLDGGSQKISFSSVSGATNTSANIIGIGAIDSSKNYILRFSMKGTKNDKSIEVMLRKSQAPYSNITPIQSFELSTSRTEHEFLFSKPNSSESDASIQFYIDEADGTVYFDNVELYEANVTVTNPDDYLRFEYNASDSPKTVSLNETYIDAKNTSYTGSVTLAPWSSVVLIKTTGADTTPPAAPSGVTVN